MVRRAEVFLHGAVRHGGLYAGRLVESLDYRLRRICKSHGCKRPHRLFVRALPLGDRFEALRYILEGQVSVAKHICDRADPGANFLDVVKHTQAQATLHSCHKSGPAILAMRGHLFQYDAHEQGRVGRCGGVTFLVAAVVSRARASALPSPVRHGWRLRVCDGLLSARAIMQITYPPAFASAAFAGAALQPQPICQIRPIKRRSAVAYITSIMKTTALYRPALLAAVAQYLPAPITPLARY